MSNIFLQEIIDIIDGVTNSHSGDLNSTVYLQEMRDAILQVSGLKPGSMIETVYLQQIRNAILGVPDGQFGSLPASIYLQQIVNAYNGVTSEAMGSLDEGVYWDEIAGVAVPPGPQYETPAYANAGGTGDRRASITITTDISILWHDTTYLVDGDTVTETIIFGGDALANKYILIDFGHKVIVNEFKLYKQNAFQGGFGNFKFQISDDAANFVDISTTFNLGAGAGTSVSHTEISANTTPARYLVLRGVSGNMQVSDILEFEFKIGNPL